MGDIRLKTKGWQSLRPLSLAKLEKKYATRKARERKPYGPKTADPVLREIYHQMYLKGQLKKGVQLHPARLAAFIRGAKGLSGVFASYPEQLAAIRARVERIEADKSAVTPPDWTVF